MEKIDFGKIFLNYLTVTGTATIGNMNGVTDLEETKNLITANNNKTTCPVCGGERERYYHCPTCKKNNYGKGNGDSVMVECPFYDKKRECCDILAVETNNCGAYKDDATCKTNGCITAKPLAGLITREEALEIAKNVVDRTHICYEDCEICEIIDDLTQAFKGEGKGK